MVMNRGDVIWVELGEPLGSEPGFRRPVLVVQADPYNDSRLATAIVMSLSNDTGLRRLPGCVFLSAGETGLPKDSVANAAQLRTIGRERLDQHAGHLEDSIMIAVDDALKSVLGL
jgi:mRNA interferase MazF